jgi:putative nucleotidyltransferase with HDIG domain
MKQHIKKYLEQLDSMTFKHSVRVMLISAEIEEYMGVTDHKLMNAALLHDLGKLYIPHNILDKNGRLTKLERELIDMHPYIGYTLLSDLGVDEDICRIVLYHHGFKPLHIKELDYYDYSSIYQKASILRTVDSFEALTSDRSYHRGVPSKEAINILLREKNYDDTAMEYLIQVSSDKGMRSSAARRGGRDISLECVERLIDKMDLCRENREPIVFSVVS